MDFARHAPTLHVTITEEDNVSDESVSASVRAQLAEHPNEFVKKVLSQVLSLRRLWPVNWASAPPKYFSSLKHKFVLMPERVLGEVFFYGPPPGAPPAAPKGYVF